MSRWGDPETVAGFSRGAPNARLLEFVVSKRPASHEPMILDVGCGAGRNALPIAALGCRVMGTDSERPMLAAAAARSQAQSLTSRTLWTLASMDRLPVRERSFDLLVAHGIWNLARSGAEFRRAVAEAARAGRPGAALFVFTFSRRTLPQDAEPVAGEPFVFTQFAGEPQCFLTESQLLSELASAGFEPSSPLTEHNLPVPGQLNRGGPVIFEGTFRLRV